MSVILAIAVFVLFPMLISACIRFGMEGEA